MANDIHLEIMLPTSPQRVMALLTDAGLMAEWSGSEVVFENKVGGQFSMLNGWVTGKVLKTSPDELACTWATTDWAEGTEHSVVEYKLVQEGDETRVVVDQKGLPSHEEMQSHTDGWYEHFFGPLEEYILEENE